MNSKIEILLKDFNAGHTEFQIDNFIIGGAGDEWSQYNQCLREIHSRREALINYEEEMELFEITPNKLRRLFWRKKRKRIERSRGSRKYDALINHIAETRREIARFVALAIELKKLIGEIDQDKRSSLEAQSWLYRARRMAGVDMIVNGRIGKQTLEMILNLPDEQRSGLLRELGNGGVSPYKLLGME